MIKNQKSIWLILTIASGTLGTLSLLGLMLGADFDRITGLSQLQVGKGTVTFTNVLCGNNETDIGEDCDPPGNTFQCPGNLTCTSNCQCPTPTPPPGGGGTSGGGQAGCPSPKNITREYNGFREYFYTCCDTGWCQEVCTQIECHIECTKGDCQRVWGLPDDWYCDDHPAVLATRVCIKAQRTYKAVTTGMCPTKRTCGALCCATGQACLNGKCVTEYPEFDLPPPPEIEEPMMVGIPFTIYAFPWWYFALAILILLFLTYLIWRKLRKLSESTPLKLTITRKKKKRKH